MKLVEIREKLTRFTLESPLASYVLTELKKPYLSIDKIAHLAYVVGQIGLPDGKLLEDEALLEQKAVDNMSKIPKDIMDTIEELTEIEFELLNDKIDNELLSLFEQIYVSLQSIVSSLLTKKFAVDPSAHVVKYDQSQIDCSLDLKSIEVSSQKNEYPAGQTLKDYLRKIVALNGKYLPLSQFNEKDQQIYLQKEIEELAGDKISQVGSKAHEIYWFGQQYLHAELLTEFMFSTELDGQKIIPLQNTRYWINWKTQGDKIIAEVTSDIESIAKADSRNAYILNSEGKALTEVDQSTEFENMLGYRAPMARVQMQIVLEQQEKEGPYFLKINKVATTYFTPKLKSIREIPVKEKIDFIKKTTLNNQNDVERAIRLLASLPDEEWEAIKNQDALWRKIVDIYIKSLSFPLTTILPERYASHLKSKITGLCDDIFGYCTIQQQDKFGVKKILRPLANIFSKIDKKNVITLQELNVIVKELNETDPQKVQEKLKLAMLLMHENKGLHSTLKSALETLVDLYNMTSTEFPGQPINKLLSLFNSAIKDSSQLKSLIYKESSVKEAPKHSPYAKEIILWSKAQHLVNKISDAIKVISDKKSSVRGNEKNALEELDKKLKQQQGSIYENMKAKSLEGDKLKKMRERTQGFVETASVTFHKPSGIFNQIIMAIRGLFSKHPKPSLEKTFENIKSSFNEEKSLKL